MNLNVFIFLLIVVSINAQGYNYDTVHGGNPSSSPANQGFFPSSTGSCCRELALLKSQQAQGRIINNHGSINNIQHENINVDSSSKGFNHGFTGGNLLTSQLLPGTGPAQYAPNHVNSKFSQSTYHGQSSLGSNYQSNSHHNHIGGSNSFGINQGVNNFVTTGNIGGGADLSSSGNHFNGAASNQFVSSTKLDSIGSHFGGGNIGGGINSINTGNVEKHIYVHVPPEDLSESAARHQIEQQLLQQQKKHYKIIFIKAPSSPSGSNYAQLLANAGGVKEKTLVYVLVKKPEEPSLAELQAVQNSVQPSKPEVYFIKYKTRKEGDLHGNGGQEFGGDFGLDARSNFESSSSSNSFSLANKDIITSSSSTGGVLNGAVNHSPAPLYGVPPNIK